MLKNIQGISQKMLSLTKQNENKLEPFDIHDIEYSLRLGENKIDINQFLNHTISLTFTGKILCIACKKVIKKTYNQGYCYPCFTSLATCDRCITSPELCHYHKNTCREPEWGEKNCMIPHIVYLSNSSHLKVGITREHQQFTRWVDQGASQSLIIAKVQNRKEAGDLEIKFKSLIQDKTNWRKLVSEAPPIINQKEIITKAKHIINKLMNTLNNDERKKLEKKITLNQKLNQFNYPILNYPSKIKSHDFLKHEKSIKKKLLGIKGQYLLFDDLVINIRKHTGYELIFSVE